MNLRKCFSNTKPISFAVFLSLFFMLPLARGNNLVQIVDPLPQAKAQVMSALSVNEASFQALDLPSGGWDDFSAAVNLGGETYTLILYPFSVRSWKFKLEVQGDDGKLCEVEPPSPLTYEGSVEGVPGSVVVASLIDGQLTARIEMGPGEHFIVQPMSKLTPDAAPGNHVVFNTSDEYGTDGVCGTLARHRIEAEGTFTQSHQGGQGASAATGLKVCEIAFDTDYQYFTQNGSSVAATVNDIESVLNGIRIIYERDVSITYEVTHIIVRTAEPDPYSTSNAEDLLGQFTDHWNTDLKQIKRDTAHLFTGKSLLGSTIGIAWVSVVCLKSSAYGLSETNFSSNYNRRVALTSHEIGHNWSAGHCSGGTCHIMCATINGCGGIGAPEFGPTSIASIASYRDSHGCVADQPDPIEPPFIDNFPSLIIDSEKWVHNNDTMIAYDATILPSVPFALNLDSSANGQFAEDELWTNFILLQGKSNHELSFWYRHSGVESGEDLVIDYWLASDEWVELTRVVSTGVNMEQYARFSYPLPGNAYHDEFRMRIRADVDESDDDWYIDNVFVGNSALVPMLASISPKAGPEAGGTPITLTGSNFTSNPLMSVRIGGKDCTNISVQNGTTLTCLTPGGNNGWKNIEIASDNGGDSLFPAYRHFPISSTPFNGSDIPTDSLTTPVETTLIVTGNALAPYLVYWSLDGGPLPTPFGDAGIGNPFYFLFLWNIGADGTSLIPLQFDPGSGPVDFYMHVLSLDGAGKPVWATGGTNPNGTGSILYHLNN